MNDTSMKKKTVSGMLWKFGENGLSQIVNFVISIILARMLLPEDYGVIALVTVFITICDKLIVSGLPTSLIQKKDADNTDFSTIFYFSFTVALVLYAVLFITAPWIARFFEAYDPKLLVDVIRVMGLQLIILSINSVQSAYVSRTMQFRCFFFSNLSGTLVSAVVGIAMAYRGFGVWALVAQYLIKMLGSTLVLWFTVKWRPSLSFSFERLKGLYSYGWKIFAASMIKVLYNDLRSLVIGKFYTSAQLAFYNKGQSFPQLVESNVTGTIDSVFFPAISRKQSSKDEMLSMLRRTIKVSSYILTPLLTGMAAAAAPLVEVLLTEKWLPCVFYMQILSLSFLLVPVEIENLQAIKAMGRSDIALKLEIIKKTIGVTLLIISIPFGVKAIALSMLVGSVANAIVDAVPNRKLLGYKFSQQIKDILPSFILSLIMFVCVYALSFLNLNVFALLAIQIIAGMAIYLGASAIFKLESFCYILNIIRSFFKKRGNADEPQDN